MSTIKDHRLLRRGLLADGLVSGAMGLLLLAAGGALAGLLGLPQALLQGAGLVLLPFAALVLWLGRATQPNATAVKAVIAINGAWVAGSALLLVTGWVAPTGLGIAFVIAQAAAVAGFAELQYVGWRRAFRAGATTPVPA